MSERKYPVIKLFLVVLFISFIILGFYGYFRYLGFVTYQLNNEKTISFYSNGNRTFNIHLINSTWYKIRVVARSTPGGTELAKMMLSLSNMSRDVFNVQTDWQEYSDLFFLNAGEYNLTVGFLNDYWGGAGNDRNLFIQSIIVDANFTPFGEVDIKLSNRTGIIKLKYGSNEKSEYLKFSTTTTLQNYQKDINSRIIRAWVMNWNQWHGGPNIPLKDDGTYNYSKLDRYIKTILDINATPYVNFVSAPNILSQGGYSNENNPPTDNIAFANYVNNVVSHYVNLCTNGSWSNCRDIGTWYWTIWNEPDCPWAFESWTTTPYPYVQIFDAVYSKVKANYPNVKIGGAEFCGISGGDAKLDKFLNSVKQGPDFVVYHKYGGSTSTSKEDLMRNVKYYYYDDVVLMKAQISRAGKNIPLMISEYNIDPAYTPAANPEIQSPFTSVWLASVLMSLIKSGMDAEQFFDGTSTAGADGFGMWSGSAENNYAVFPTYTIMRQFTTMHKTGNYILESKSDDVFIDSLVSQGDDTGVVLVNMRNISMLIQVNFDTNVDLMSYEKNPIKGNVRAINISLEPYSLKFYYLKISSSNIPNPKYGILFNNTIYSIKVGGVLYINDTFNDTKEVMIIKNNDPQAKFYYDFSQGILNLNNLDVQEVSGYIIVKNLNVNNKTIYLDRVSNASRICIEDADINSISDISANCKSANEYLLQCPGTNGRYSCNIVNNKYEISGMSHSGAKEYSCSLAWICSFWTGCFNDSQSRTCSCGCYSDADCTGDHTLRQSCTCSLPWSCTNWSGCIGGVNVRSCNCGCGIDSECTGDNSEQQACTCSQPWSCTNWSSCINGTQSRNCVCDCEVSSDCYGNNTIEQSCTIPPAEEQPSPPPSGGGGGGGGGGGIIIPPNATTNNTPIQNQTTNLSTNNSINPPVQNQTINYTEPPKNTTNTTKAAGKTTAPGQIRKKISTTTAKLIESMAQVALDATTLTFIGALFLLTMAALIMHRKARVMHPRYFQGMEQMQAYEQRIAHLKPREQHYKELASYIQKSRDAGVEEQVIIRKLKGAGWKAEILREYMKR